MILKEDPKVVFRYLQHRAFQQLKVRCLFSGRSFKAFDHCCMVGF